VIPKGLAALILDGGSAQPITLCCAVPFFVPHFAFKKLGLFDTYSKQKKPLRERLYCVVIPRGLFHDPNFYEGSQTSIYSQTHSVWPFLFFMRL
jgi:hypothetical protein